MALTAIIPALFCSMPGAAGATPTVTVRTQTLKYGEIAQPVSAYGVIGTAPGAVSAITLHYAAKVARLYVQSGQTVARGAPLFAVQADPAAVAAAKQAVAALTLARKDFVHTQALYVQSLATQSQLDAARKSVLDAAAAAAAEQAVGVGNGDATVTAPADGVVTQIAFSQGDQVPAGAAIVQLALRAPAAGDVANVNLAVDPADAIRIHTGDRVALSGLSPALSRVSVQGRVVVVGAAVDPQSQLVNIGAVVPVGGTRLLPGMHVKGVVSTQAGKHWIVPRSAVLRDGRGAYVFQVGNDRRAHRVAVQARIENGDVYGVDGALDAATPLVVTGNYELHDGDAVHVETVGSVHGNKEAGQ